MERRLTAILAADVQGYTHHTERNEEASTTTLRLYRAVVEEAIFAHKGHIFSSAGDGVVAEFYGTGVNVVARLEQLAVLGGICVSQTVYDQVRKIVEIPFQDIGARRLKNTGPNGQDVATLEVDYYPGVTPKLGKWNFDIATYYVAYPAPSIQTATLTISSCGVAFRAACSTTSWKSNYNYWSPDYFGETGNNDVLEFSYAWTFGKVGHITPKLAGNFGHQWGTLSEGGYDYTYWSVALKLGFNENPPLELEIRYWDSFDVRGSPVPLRGWTPATILLWALSKRHSKRAGD